MIFVLSIMAVFNIKITMRLIISILLYYIGLVILFIQPVKNKTFYKIKLKKIVVDNSEVTFIFFTTTMMVSPKIMNIILSVMIFILGVLNDVDEAYILRVM